MPTIISGDGTITGLTTTGISAVQTVSATNITTGTLPFSVMPTGSVLQVVNSSTGTTVSSNSNTYIDTTLTATITPKFSSSKILVLVHQNGMSKNGGNVGADIALRLLRDSTNIHQIGLYIAYTGSTIALYTATSSTSYLDSPATTSATTYKTQFCASENTGGVVVQVSGGNSVSTMTLLEIAA